jgi:hypothetical protein
MPLVMNMGGKSAKQLVDEDKEANLLEPGAYEVALTKCEVMKKPRPGVHGATNTQVRMTFTVQAGAKQGRTITRMIGIDHPSEPYVNSSRAFVSKLALALGDDGFVGDLETLVNRPVVANVTVKKAREGSDYGPQNDIKSFASLSGGMPSTKPAPKQEALPLSGESGPAAAPAGGLSGAGAPPWKR